jgi:hypothetical protein
MSAPPTAALSSLRLAALGALAAVLHGGLDAASSAAGATPPYLRLADAPEAFRVLSPFAVSVAFSAVSGVIAAIALVVVSASRRGAAALPLGVAIAALWILSAALSRVAWFDTPAGPTLLSIACGVPRGLAIGWILTRLSRPAVSGKRAAAA